ncbi:Hypothetical protein LUCI_0847 [Lucifera butyrica]|uniref:Uncharacterized protein n=1 Tax=Lucifera butyrica TaxID=1351585 RepID=A0A498R478_9FIRM|nr:CBO0543 family protein [Lucifera butyrica]VBB05637.1 Hypothetical protein LUCI_0847 [Lucifera butyrica]
MNLSPMIHQLGLSLTVNQLWVILLFRIFLVLGFLLSAWKWGDWENQEKYYPTILFTMTVDLSVSFLVYRHSLWNYPPDALVKTQTVAEFINCFFILTATTFTYLSKFPAGNRLYQIAYMVLWISIYSGLEWIDSQVIKGIYYTNGWSWSSTALFDCIMFSILRLHYLKPFWAWIITFLITAFILVVFNFASAEMK